jgi:tetratricopeptide (TPR) repeat protein
LTAANVFSIQSEIAKTVADALRATLSPEEEDQFAMVPTENLAAYQAYLLGKQRLAEEMSATVVEAVDYFQQAVDLDPNYALAYAGLADSYTLLGGWFGTMPRDEAFAKAQAAADKALALDAQSGEAYNSLAGISDERGDLVGAEAAYQRALELNLNYAYAYSWYGEMLRNKLARPEEALVLHLTGIELDPLSAPMMAQVAWDLQALGRHEESLAWFENAIEIEPGYSESYVGLGRYYWTVLGQLDEAVVVLRKAISLDPGRIWTYDELGEVFLNLGDPDRAEYWYGKSRELRPERFSIRHSMMFLHLYRGDEAAVADRARKLMADFPRSADPLMLLRNHELKAGRYVEARALYEKMRPELLSDDVPEVEGVDPGLAIDLALVLLKTGETERADLLLRHSHQYNREQPRYDSVLAAQTFALQGKKQKALSALRQSMDEGWRGGWWYFFKHEPNLESLHDEPEYQVMVAEIEADMAEQLARVREMERNGELEPIPEVSATTH